MEFLHKYPKEVEIFLDQNPIYQNLVKSDLKIAETVGNLKENFLKSIDIDMMKIFLHFEIGFELDIGFGWLIPYLNFLDIHCYPIDDFILVFDQQYDFDENDLNWSVREKYQFYQKGFTVVRDVEAAARYGFLKLVKEWITPDQVNKLLAIAARSGQLPIVEYLIDTYPYINSHDYYEAAYRDSAKNGHLSVFQRLIQLSRPSTDHLESYLFNAAANGHLEIVKYLFQILNSNLTPRNLLITAAENGRLNIVQYAMEDSPEPRIINKALDRSLKNNHLEVGEYLIPYSQIQTFDLTDYIENLDIVKFLVDHGIDIQANNNYALRLSLSKGHYDITRYLLDHGANLEAQGFHIQ